MRQALLPVFISPVTGHSTTEALSLGAMGDSYYEYLLKVCLRNPPVQAAASSPGGRRMSQGRALLQTIKGVTFCTPSLCSGATLPWAT